ncbi:IS110 family transposase [Flaviaesturariibacter amylovorans]|uniref:IS110 family transposase n=1 Tax=Flaviaesturariibacter amylovorans TaxID=1084520 RepID=A0ABP8HVF9_9BACT
MKLVCGIDVSKDTLDLHYNTASGNEVSLRVKNNEKGHLKILEVCGQRTYLMEASGPYYLKLACTLKQEGGDVRVENPVRIRRYIQMGLERNKNDKKDARWLYRYALERGGQVWQLPSEEALRCSAITASIDLLTRQKTAITNQVHSLKQLPGDHRELTRTLTKMMMTLAKEIKVLEQKLLATLKQWKGDQLTSISSIPGLGKRATALLITMTNGFKKIQNHRQLIALAGLAPREHTSGSSIKGKKGICKMGSGHLRNVLYMCSLSAIQHNKACKELYERLKKAGKKSKVALIAVCNKLLKQAFAIATKGTTYQADFKSQLA